MKQVKESFAVLGLSKFGYQSAVYLAESGADVIAIDKEESLVQKISAHVRRAVCADLKDWEVLEHTGVLSVDTVIIGLRRSFDVATLLTYKFKHHTDVKRVIVQVDNEEKAEAIKLIGADVTVFPEKYSAEKIVRQLTVPNLVDHILLTPETAIVEVPVPSAFMGKSLVELNIRANFGINVIGIKSIDSVNGSEKITVAPLPDAKFKKGDNIFVLGESVKLNKFLKRSFD
ncbi:MAG: TrkA family potassium uptake protein [Oligoflexia bacterium]|nr:TrkA family potassium uptake protein [Oligoflexia bacterium]